MRVRIASGLIEGILAAAAADPEREVCGLLLGTHEEVVAILPADNLAKNPADSFEIDPTLLFAAHRAARAGGPAIVGHYHSHPRGPCAPSPRDAAAAVPGQLWLIVADQEAALFRSGAGGFAPCTMINTAAAGCGSTPHSSEGRRRVHGRGQGPR